MKIISLVYVMAVVFNAFATMDANAGWRGWDKFFKSIDPTNPKTWEDLGDSIADVCHWGPGQGWIPKHGNGPTVYVGWRADQMPFSWQNLNNAWNNPQDFSGMMVTRGDVFVVAHDYIPLVAKVESHSQICIELKESLNSMEPYKESTAIPIHNTVMQMDEENCENVPEWARKVSGEGREVLRVLANTDWSKVDWSKIDFSSYL